MVKGKDIPQEDLNEQNATGKSEDEKIAHGSQSERGVQLTTTSIPENVNHAVMDNNFMSSVAEKNTTEKISAPATDDVLKGKSTISLKNEVSVGVSNMPSPENSPSEVSDPIVESESKSDASKGPETSKGEMATTPVSKPEIRSLPLDSLHCIASFLTPSEWCNGFGLVNKTINTQCREIVRRVRMHAFKCATEVVCAWKVGQWEDARELAALYIAAGVPIYSRCLGNSFRTVHWRMKVEATEILAKLNAETSDSIPENTEEVKHVGDCFFGAARTEFRSNEGHRRDLTYLEEKCLFWVDRNSPVDARGGNHTPNHRRRHPRNEDVTARRSTSPPQSRATPHQENSPKKIPVAIHQHLLDRHRLGEYFVNDQDGRMATPMASLSADFFHPSARIRRIARSEAVAPAEDPSTTSNNLDMSNTMLSVAAEEESVWDPARGEELPPPPPALSIQDPGDLAVLEPQSPKSVLSSVVLEVYSSTIASSLDGFDDLQEVKWHLRSRFATYQRRLEAFLAKSDTSGFKECILDFWDEFFPHTAGIHYHDLQTAIPRMSCMHKFLTKPCPKAIGVVQCEIERIKITSRGKGVNVKGRLFPTYEYRLFIRNRPLNAIGDSPETARTEGQEDFVRRDTVLMVAKNRGRKHTEPSGVVPMSAASKKGANNYYLYMPQQLDVDGHFNKCNEHLDTTARLEPNGASHSPVLVSDDAGSVLLGRLQSNFIGTEFQIFTPRPRKQPRHSPDPATSRPFSSEDELDYDSGVSSDNTRRSRFGRFRRSSAANPANSDAGGVSSSSAMDRPKVKRSVSSPDVSQPIGRQPRTNRRAIANDAQPTPHSAFCEEEGGAITYTANLLGSRPRIMDVCIPKVTLDGVPGVEWKRYLETCDDTDDCRMLGCFRQLQQRRENQEQQNPHAPDVNTNQDAESEAGDETDFGLVALQNRPPWWNVELGSFVLNFGGRVSVASVKNFQLCERTNQDMIMLQFGRINGRHSFTMDFQHPLTAVQAFSIAISSLQSKISFG